LKPLRPEDRNAYTERLEQLWSEHLAMRFPGIPDSILGEYAVHFVDAQGYIAGLVSTYLGWSEIKYPAIVFDEAAQHEALARLTSEGNTALRPFIDYGNILMELATTLSRATGVPLVRPTE
jgi:hypothetical protein